MQKLSSANNFQVFPSFIYTSVQCTLSYLLCSPPKCSPLDYSGKEISKQEMHCSVRWIDSENFKSTALVGSSSGYARTIYQILLALWSLWALNHSYLVCQTYCADRPSSKFILFCLQIPLILVHFQMMCDQMLSYILRTVKKFIDFDVCAENNFWKSNSMVWVFFLKIISQKQKACFNFASQIGSQDIYL